MHSANMRGTPREENAACLPHSLFQQVILHESAEHAIWPAAIFNARSNYNVHAWMGTKQSPIRNDVCSAGMRHWLRLPVPCPRASNCPNRSAVLDREDHLIRQACCACFVQEKHIRVSDCDQLLELSSTIHACKYHCFETAAVTILAVKTLSGLIKTQKRCNKVVLFDHNLCLIRPPAHL